MERLRVVRGHVKKHQTMLSILLVLFILISLANYFNYSLTQQQMQTYYLKAFEKKSLSELDIFHQGTTELIEASFMDKLDALGSIARDEGVIRLAGNNQYSGIQEILDRQRTANKHFTTYTLFNKQGNSVVSSSDFLDVHKKVGENFAYRPYFKHALSATGPTIGEIFIAATGRDIIIFTAPIRSSSGQVTHVLTGSIALPIFAQRLKLDSKFDELYSVLVDKEGTVILDAGQAPGTRLRISAKDRVVAQLIAGEVTITDEEINYRDEQVFAMGSAIAVGNENSVYLVSYYPKEQFTSKIALVKNELDRVFVGILVRDFVLLLLTFIIIIWLINRHEKLILQQ